MSKLSVRIASVEEYMTCLQIRESVFVEEQHVPKKMELEFEEESTHFLAYFDEIAVATGRFRVYHGCLKFERIATLRSMRGKGVGTVLMQKMLEVAKRKYPEYLPFMHAQKDAVKFYKKLGWISIGEPFVEADIEHEAMIFFSDKEQHFRCLDDPECPEKILEYFQKI